MKKNKTLLVLASVGLASTLLAACNDKAPNSSDNNDSTDSSIVSEYDAGAITQKEDSLPVLKVGETIDLDTYFGVKKDSGEITQRFGITNTNAEGVLTIDGHKVTVNQIGTFEIRLVSADSGKYVTIDCRSEMNVNFINLMKSLDEVGGTNYTLDIGEYNVLTRKFSYKDATYIHNPNYAGAYNKNNLGELSQGEPNSFLIASLADGKDYFGHFDSTGKPVFENGSVTMSNYYIAMPLSLDGLGFSSSQNNYGEEILVADASTAMDFLHYGSSQFPERRGFEVTGMYVSAVTDEDGDGIVDSAIITPTIKRLSDGATGIYADYKIYNIGKSTLDVLEPVRTDVSYIPQKIVTTELASAFSKLATDKNYTITMDAYPATEDGTEIPLAEVEDTSAYTTLLSTKEKFHQVTKVTTDGIEADFQEGGVTKVKRAYWNDKGVSYEAAYQAAEGSAAESKTKEAISGVTDVFTTDAVKRFTTASVTAAAIDAANWSKRAEDESAKTITWSGVVGDNDGTTVTNAFYQQIFDQFIAPNWTLQTGGTVGFGGHFTASGMLTNGGSLTWASDYKGVTLNTETGEITVDAILGLLFSDVTQHYIRTTYTISAIGTTTNDFTAYADYVAPAA